ncbi:MAG: TGS domain-containing protein, partial [Oscillospiraceae bacterium]|nr:TGS domain-containing protein [Oscillospiraceae bacterium]
HEMFTVMQGRFKDYIANPKINGYQSLHTVVLGKEGQAFEVQIRTHEMHTTARFGVAAHWKYKTGLNSNKLESKFGFIRNLLEQQWQSHDTENLSRIIRDDIAGDEVEVFTPQGDVKHLPKESTVIDFAYAVHTEIGNKMVSAKVHGKNVGLRQMLKTGDVVEVVLSDEPDYGPNRSWIDYVKTNLAKSKIRHWLKHNRKDENMLSGREYVKGTLMRMGIDFEENQNELTIIANNHRYNNLEAFFEAIGYGGVEIKVATEWISDGFKEELDKKSSMSFSNSPNVSNTSNTAIKASSNNEKNKKEINTRVMGVIIEGGGDCSVKLANCCSPLPGDDIIGFATKGYGVSIHKKGCANIAYRMKIEADKNRVVSVKWQKNSRILYPATIEVIALDISGMLMNIITIISKDHNIRIIGSHSSILKNGKASFSFSIEVLNVAQLGRLIKTLGKTNGVLSVKRTNAPLNS